MPISACQILYAFPPVEQELQERLAIPSGFQNCFRPAHQQIRESDGHFRLKRPSSKQDVRAFHKHYFPIVQTSRRKLSGIYSRRLVVLLDMPKSYPE